MSTNLYIENEVMSVKTARAIESKLGLNLVNASATSTIQGNLVVNGTLTAGSEMTTSQVITAASANAFAVGANGTTNPAFNVDTSTTSVATGLNIKGAAAGGGLALSTITSGTNESMTIDAAGSGTITINGASTTSGRVTIGNATAHNGLAVQGLILGTSANANALVVGPNGSTNPTLQVDASTASAATGLKVKSAAQGSGVAVSAQSAGTNENLTIAAQGSGGTITFNPAITATAGGAAADGVMFGSLGVGVFTGTGAPTFSAMNGSLYVDSNGTTTTGRLYINKSGAGTAGTTWTNFTAAA